MKLQDMDFTESDLSELMTAIVIFFFGVILGIVIAGLMV